MDGVTGSAHVRRRLRVSGTVQGVGFRPYIHRLATSVGLTGAVGNDSAGVWIEVEGPAEVVESFISRIAAEAPPLARVRHVQVEARQTVAGSVGFVVAASTEGDDATGSAALPPDTAMCPACRREVLDPADRRYRHPFASCTDCGPRFTIIDGLPYDRPRTTMAAFAMCPACQREYDDPTDRRFHAQPIACPDCGPVLAMRRSAGAAAFERDAALAAAITDLRAGYVVAVKGLGGYHLACDARSPAAVATLRMRKHRGDKPFAVLVRDLDVARRLCVLTAADEALLASAAAPIVLVPPRRTAEAAAVSAAVAPGNGRLGIMLPPTPLHLLLLTEHPDLAGPPLDAVVLTSCNLADEPICTDDVDVLDRFGEIADSFLQHDRRIHLPCDDSVVHVVDGPDGPLAQPVRRSRGYAPSPIELPARVPPTLAVGGELKNALCLADRDRAWMSQHIGDTGSIDTLTMLERVAELLMEVQRVRPVRYVADRHPAYLSRRWAAEQATAHGAELITVQHHHAHLASLLAEHGIDPQEPVLGVTFDGTGFGDDGTIWGGEFLLGSYGSYERVASLVPVPLPGGDAAVRRPARVALAHLRAAGVVWDPALPPVAACAGTEATVVARLLETGVSCVATTSVGRLFDAIASLAGVAQDAQYEAQAAIELEALAEDWLVDAGAAGPRMLESPIALIERSDRWLLDPGAVVREVAAAALLGVPAGAIGAAFHRALADAVVATATRIRAAHGVTRVGLTGGVFQNALLTRLTARGLTAAGFDVLVHREVPPNDGGLALGQVLVAELSH